MREKVGQRNSYQIVLIHHIKWIIYVSYWANFYSGRERRRRYAGNPGSTKKAAKVTGKQGKFSVCHETSRVH